MATVTRGFGLVRIKAAGSPIHPDDMYCATQAQYTRQLVAYEKYWSEPESEDSQREKPSRGFPAG